MTALFFCACAALCAQAPDAAPPAAEVLQAIENNRQRLYNYHCVVEYGIHSEREDLPSDRPILSGLQEVYSWNGLKKVVSDEVEDYRIGQPPTRVRNTSLRYRDGYRILRENPGGGKPAAMITGQEPVYMQTHSAFDKVFAHTGHFRKSIIDPLTPAEGVTARMEDGMVVLELARFEDTITLDPRKGMMPVYFLSKIDGELVDEARYEDYRAVGDGLWLPFRITERHVSRDKAGNTSASTTRSVVKSFEPLTSRPDAFELPFPPNARVTDNLSDLRSGDYEALKKLEAEVGLPVPRPKAAPANETVRSIRKLLVSAGGLLVATIIVFIAARRRGRA